MISVTRVRIFPGRITISMALRISERRRLCSLQRDSDCAVRGLVLTGGRVENVGDGLVDHQRQDQVGRLTGLRRGAGAPWRFVLERARRLREILLCRQPTTFAWIVTITDKRPAASMHRGQRSFSSSMHGDAVGWNGLSGRELGDDKMRNTVVVESLSGRCPLAPDDDMYLLPVIEAWPQSSVGMV